MKRTSMTVTSLFPLQFLDGPESELTASEKS